MLASPATTPATNGTRAAWLATLRVAIARGEYRVDPRAVADAALRDAGFRRQVLRG